MAVEMATPGRAGLMRSLVTARAPAKPAKTATSRSRSVGEVLDSISGVTSVVMGADPRRAPNAMARITPPTSARAAFPTSAAFPLIIPRAMPKMGVMSGDTSIAPMTTAALLATRPRLAMREAAEIRA
jgi:hypothetical protein